MLGNTVVSTVAGAIEENGSKMAYLSHSARCTPFHSPGVKPLFVFIVRRLTAVPDPRTHCPLPLSAGADSQAMRRGRQARRLALLSSDGP